MDLHTILVILHVAGVILGVGGATIAEVNLIQALRDGKIDSSEKALMHANYTVIRVGMVFVLLSGLALVWWWLTVEGNDWVITSGKILVKDVMMGAIFLNAFLLTKHWVPLWLGAAISFTSWWGATILGLWRTSHSFWAILIAYIIAIGLVALAQHLIRKKFIPKH